MQPGGCGLSVQCSRQEGSWERFLDLGLKTGRAVGAGMRTDGPSVRWGRIVPVLAEVGGISELTEACDWWSYGSLLYELLTGMVSRWVGRVSSAGGDHWV